MSDVSAIENKLVYLDNNATTKCRTEVVEAMIPYLNGVFGNTESPHIIGRQASRAVERSREEIAELLGARPFEIFFTSGATESNNYIFQSYARTAGVRRKIAVSAIEHKSILKAAESLSKLGFEVVTLPVSPNGVVDVAKVRTLVDSGVGLVSVMHSNNETGVLQPIDELAEIAHEIGAFFHCDAVQSLGKVELNMADAGIDSAVFSAHKVHGPKGVGIMYCKGGVSKFSFETALHGGGQEMGLRPGTVNVPAIVGMAKALRLALTELDEANARMSALRDRLEKAIVSEFPECIVFGKDAERLCNTLDVSFPGIPSDMLIANLQQVCIGTGSACNSREVAPSHVLLAMGIPADTARGAVRFSLSGEDTPADIEFAISEVLRVVNLLKEAL